MAAILAVRDVAAILAERDPAIEVVQTPLPPCGRHAFRHAPPPVARGGRARSADGEASGGVMTQREVQDDENVRWVCVQALAGVDGAAADAAAARLADENGGLPVVCTPSGGAQSVRLRLAAGWDDALSDADLLAAIGRARGDGA